MKEYSFDISIELNKAIQYHQSGQLQKAEKIYKKILEINSNHSDSLHLLGVIARQVGKSDMAVSLINEAIKNNPKRPIYYNNLGAAFQDQGKLTEAASCYKKALDLEPDDANAYNNLGAAFQGQGNLTDAISCYEKAVQIKPDYEDAYYNMGTAFQDQGKLSEAILSYEKAVQIKPDYADAHNNLGSAFQNQGNLTDAISCYEKAVQTKPDYANAYYNMGTAFQDEGNLTDAISCYEKALQIKPDYAKASYNLGNALKDQDRLSEAISCYKKALDLKPDDANAYNNLGAAFQGQGNLNEAISCYEKVLQIEPDNANGHNNLGTTFQDKENLPEAISCYQKALQLKPDCADAWYNLGNAFQDHGKSEEAIACYQKALQIKPDLAEAYSWLLNQLQQTCAWREIGDLATKVDDLTKKALSTGTKTAEMPLLSLARYIDPPLNFAIAKSWSCKISRQTANLKTHFSFSERSFIRTKTTVGYLSNDLRDHPVAHLMLSLFGLHDRSEFQIFCYSYGKDDRSYYRERIQRDCDKFVDIRSLSHAEAGRSIYEDKVDILVDLMGHTKGSRLGICALRPSPIQVSYLGFPGTTGADFFDYIITDKIVTPEDQAPFYSENFVYLPHCYMVTDYTQAMSNKNWQTKGFGLPEDTFIFCSFNNAYKIEPVMFDSWMKILRQSPETVLWLQRTNQIAEKNLRQEAEARGIESERLIFAEKLPKKGEHLSRLRLADVVLDTRIYNGHTSTTDALWGGVPVITLHGSHFASRASSSILTAIGLSELITHSLEEYEALAVRMARNPDELQGIRRKLNTNRLTKPLFDTPRFAKNLEKAYKEMWDIFIAGERPRQIEVIES